MFPHAKAVAVPIADGGEGTVDCFLSAVGGRLIKCETVNPFFEKMVAPYGMLSREGVAVIEMATCAGLPLVEGRKDPMLATTYGVGILIKAAIKQGGKRNYPRAWRFCDERFWLWRGFSVRRSLL